MKDDSALFDKARRGHEQRQGADPSIARTDFLFDHLQKTGGTTLRAIFAELFGDDAVSPPVVGRPIGWALRHYGQYRVINGHFDPVPGDGKTDRQAITLLRHPVDRVVSYYRYLRGAVSPEQGGPPAVAARSLALNDFLDWCGDLPDNPTTNFMARHFAMRRSRDIKDDRHCLDLARAALADYPIVGLTDKLEETVALFCFTYGLSNLPMVPRLNVSPVESGDEHLEPRTRDRLLEANAVDLALYEDARAALATRQRAMLCDCIRAGESSLVTVRRGSAAVAETPRLTEENFGDRQVEICDVRVAGARSSTNVVEGGETVALRIGIRAHVDVPALTVGIEIRDLAGTTAFGTNTHLLGLSRPVSAGRVYVVDYHFPANLEIGLYRIGIALHTGASHTEHCFHWWDGAGCFRVAGYGGLPFVGYSRLPVRVDWGPENPLIHRLRGWAGYLWGPAA